ncbi:MAG: recombination protein RecR [Kiritimatiellae bacterium]|nr:recombination protein RecR [Kiritimatiellia bacterium]
MIPQPIAELEHCLAKLPGFGRRSAARAALALVRDKAKLLDPLAYALAEAKSGVACCSRCGGFTVAGSDPCHICLDAMRDGSSVCVVEEPSDIIAIEASGAFKGRYHALGGKLAPSRRMTPDRLRFKELEDRVVQEGIREVLIAVSTDMEGDATASYIAELLRHTGVRMTRLAFGLPADSGIAYSDPLTLRRAINGRMEA